MTEITHVGVGCCHICGVFILDGSPHAAGCANTPDRTGSQVLADLGRAAVAERKAAKLWQASELNPEATSEERERLYHALQHADYMLKRAVTAYAKTQGVE